MTAVVDPASRDSRRTHTVRGGGGLRLHVREWGNADGPPILFLHGWSQSHLCWAKQYGSGLAGEFRLVACDLRGHGMSEMPPEPEHYNDGALWAGDVAAVIDQLGLDRPVLVGWSYGAFLICDYLRAYGDDLISAIVFTGGAVRLNEAALGTLIGPGFVDNVPGAVADDLPSNIQAIRNLVKAWPAAPYPREDVEALLCAGMVVPAHIRANLVAREIDGDDVLRTLAKPLLVAHGQADTVVLPAMAEHIVAVCRFAEASWYSNVGHTPHLEQPGRFNRELAALTRRTAA